MLRLQYTVVLTTFLLRTPGCGHLRVHNALCRDCSLTSVFHAAHGVVWRPWGERNGPSVISSTHSLTTSQSPPPIEHIPCPPLILPLLLLTSPQPLTTHLPEGSTFTPFLWRLLGSTFCLFSNTKKKEKSWRPAPGRFSFCSSATHTRAPMLRPFVNNIVNCDSRSSCRPMKAMSVSDSWTGLKRPLK